MDIIRDADIDPAPLAGKRICIIGYGNQGRAQALNLKDSGHDVIIGLREASPSAARVEADGLRHAPLPDAPRGAALTMMLIPDEVMTGVYGEIEASLEAGSALGFSHGLAIHFGFIRPRDDLDVVMVAPKGPGTALRSLYMPPPSPMLMARRSAARGLASSPPALPKNAKQTCSMNRRWSGAPSPPSSRPDLKHWSRPDFPKKSPISNA